MKIVEMAAPAIWQQINCPYVEGRTDLRPVTVTCSDAVCALIQLLATASHPKNNSIVGVFTKARLMEPVMRGLLVLCTHEVICSIVDSLSS
jgi:hypothetical protein